VNSASTFAQDVAAFVGTLQAAQRVTAICHENPDADTVGGAVAIALIARALGKDWELVSVDPPASSLDYLPLFDAFHRAPEGDPGVAVVCDAATLERVGRIRTECADWFGGATLVNIDHHVTNDRFGTVNVVDASAAATCQVIAAALPALGVTLDEELATALLTGIVRDSHGFSDPSTSGETMRITAELVDAGAPLAMIHRRVISELPYEALALWGRLLGSLGSHRDGQVIFTTLTPDMLESTGATDQDADGLAELIGKARGADVSLLLRASGPSATRVSVRVTEAVDATRIVRAFGGGGHARRAGCTVPEPAERALPLLLRECDRVIEELRVEDQPRAST
jgi:phosphoesterase RecJ-like protein